MLKDEIKYRKTQPLFDINNKINTKMFENLESFSSIWLKIKNDFNFYHTISTEN